MKLLLRSLPLLIAGVLAMPLAFAQADNGNGACAPKVEVSYYKIVPGKQDEWLALYQKWHRRIMLYEVAHGIALSTKMYETSSHSPGMPWEIAIINVYPPEPPPGAISRAALIRKLYPNLKEYLSAERERWALTVDHWDEMLLQMNEDEPLSVFAPVDGFCKPGSQH